MSSNQRNKWQARSLLGSLVILVLGIAAPGLKQALPIGEVEVTALMVCILFTGWAWHLYCNRRSGPVASVQPEHKSDADMLAEAFAAYNVARPNTN